MKGVVDSGLYWAPPIYGNYHIETSQLCALNLRPTDILPSMNPKPNDIILDPEPNPLTPST